MTEVQHLHGKPRPVRLPKLEGAGLLQVAATLKAVLVVLEELIETMAEHGLVTKE